MYKEKQDNGAFRYKKPKVKGNENSNTNGSIITILHHLPNTGKRHGNDGSQRQSR